jgi:hypothetical protein
MHPLPPRLAHSDQPPIGTTHHRAGGRGRASSTEGQLAGRPVIAASRRNSTIRDSTNERTLRSLIFSAHPCNTVGRNEDGSSTSVRWLNLRPRPRASSLRC